MVAGRPVLILQPRGPRLLRRCPVCGEQIHFQAVAAKWWWLIWRHCSICTEGPKLALLAESQSGVGDWLAFAAGLGMPAEILNEIAVRLGVLPPTEKTLGRLLEPLEARSILQAYRKVNGEDDGKTPDEDL